MGKCPNCGRATARTEDWACQWCGYPLLSGFYKKIPKTFKQLKEEETEASILPDHVPLMPTHTAEPAPIPEPAPAPEPEPKSIPEPKPVSKPEQVLKPKPKPVSKPKQVLEPKPKPVSKPEQVLKPKPKPISKPKQVLEPKPEPVPAAKETTVEQLISAYAADEAAADAEFVDKILKLTGVVTKIEASDTLDIYYIVLTGTEKKGLQGIRCVFDKKYGAELTKLTKEQTVTVQGKYNGSIIAMRMRDCVLGS